MDRSLCSSRGSTSPLPRRVRQKRVVSDQRRASPNSVTLSSRRAMTRTEKHRGRCSDRRTAELGQRRTPTPFRTLQALETLHALESIFGRELDWRDRRSGSLARRCLVARRTRIALGDEICRRLRRSVGSTRGKSPVSSSNGRRVFRLDWPRPPSSPWRLLSPAKANSPRSRRYSCVSARCGPIIRWRGKHGSAPPKWPGSRRHRRSPHARRDVAQGGCRPRLLARPRLLCRWTGGFEGRRLPEGGRLFSDAAGAPLIPGSRAPRGGCRLCARGGKRGQPGGRPDSPRSMAKARARVLIDYGLTRRPERSRRRP